MSIFGSNPLAEQRVLILGGSGAMGAATAAEIIALGGDAILAGRNEKKLLKVSRELGHQASFTVADVSKPQALDELLHRLEAIDHIVIAISADAAASSISGTDRISAEQGAVSLMRTSLQHRAGVGALSSQKLAPF